MRMRIGGKLPRVVDHVVGRAKFRQLSRVGRMKHVVHEQRVIGASTDDTNLQAVLRIPTSETIEDINSLARVEVIDRALAVDEKDMFIEFEIDRPPPDFRLAVGMVDDPLIERRAARLFAGANHQRAAVGDEGLFVLDRVFIESRRRRVADDVRDIDL